MKLGLYCMHDAKVGFLSVAASSNDFVARRNFENACAVQGSILRTHSQDFTLYKVGEFDDASGEITPFSPPVFICNAPQFDKE